MVNTLNYQTNTNTLPSRQEVVLQLQGLINGLYTRVEVSDWATKWVVEDDPNAEISDEGVWEALESLSGADLPTTDRPYLFEVEDFKIWLAELLES